MSILEKLKLLRQASRLLEAIPMNKMWEYLQGKKSYLFTILWGLYRIAVSHGWMAENATLETSLIAGAGLSFRDAIAKK